MLERGKKKEDFRERDASHDDIFALVGINVDYQSKAWSESVAM